MTDRIIVINPNSSQACTDGIDAALDPLRFDGAPEIECLTLAEGPPGIETQRHVDGVIAPMCRLVEANDNRASAFVISCFSDPGLHAVRETTRKPVLGIAESAMLTACTLGDRFGIIAILPASITRHRRYIRQMGLEGRLAADLPVGVGVTDLADEGAVAKRMVGVGHELVDGHGADVVILGCAGMAHYRQMLEADLGVPVVDPTQAATAQALAAIRLGYTTGGA